MQLLLLSKIPDLVLLWIEVIDNVVVVQRVSFVLEIE